MMVFDMEDEPELHSAMGEGSNASIDEADETFEPYAESNFPALDTPNDQDDGMQVPGVPLGEI